MHLVYLLIPIPSETSILSQYKTELHENFSKNIYYKHKFSIITL